MTPKQKVQNLWPEAWCERATSGSRVWVVRRHSMRGIEQLGEGLTPALAWKNAAWRQA